METPTTPIVTIGRILDDMENLDRVRVQVDEQPSYVARQSRRLRGLLEQVLGKPIPRTDHERSDV